ncbi:DNA-3-methyladenine glycosylase [Paenibacillus sp. CC-CFT747]|nr:DNA-3-methyladenine glycosylase [Paenibacillus sp. CC-CFT747]
MRLQEQGQGALELTFGEGAPRPSWPLSQAVSYIREWLDGDTDLRPFYRMAENDGLLGPLTRRYRGLRIIGAPDLFEALCWAVTGQQINLPFAYTLKRRLVESFGRSLEAGGWRHWLFPQPEELADVPAEALKALQFTGRKAEYLLEIARLMADGELSKEGLLALGFTEAERRLLAIRGIGAWTAHYAMMRCLRHPAAFPIGDAGLHNALKQQLGLNRKPPEEEIRRIFSPWSGWEAYAVFYLWRSLT